jgi:Prokaryotic glutathione synthetase, ATP-grasp domain
MLLILTNSQDATAEFLVPVLYRQGIDFLRFDTDRSVQATRLGYQAGRPILSLGGRQFSPDDFRNVWYRRPGKLCHEVFGDSGDGAFAYGEWAEALEGFLAHIPMERWMNYPAHNVAASHKIEQLTTARALGLTAPATLMTQDADELCAFYAEQDGKVVAKPMASGYVKSAKGEVCSLVYTNRVRPLHLQNLSDVSACPTLFQQYIEKQHDVRITIVDGYVHAVALIAREPDGRQRCDVRRNNMADVSYRTVSVPSEVERGLTALAAYYSLRFAAIDMAVGKDGNWYFFEVNPNGQWAWLDEAGVTDIAATFVKAFAP